jgi:hypothetical protein
MGRSRSRQPTTKSKTRSASCSPRRLIALVLCVLAALQLYLIAFKLPPMTFYSGDCGTKLLQVQSLVAQHWRSPAVVYPGRAIDPDLRFVETGMLLVRKGRVWGVHSLVFAVLSSFPYARIGYPGLYLVPALSLLGVALLVWLLANRLYGPWRALLATSLVAFSSPLLFYGVEFWEHTLAVFAVMAAVWMLSLACEVPGRRLHLVGAGALLGLACAVRPEATLFLVAAALGAAAVIRPLANLASSLASLLIGCAAVLVPTALINLWLFGDPLGTALGLHLRTGHPDPRLLIVEKLLAPLTVETFWKLACAILAALALWRLSVRERSRRPDWVSLVLGIVAGGLMLSIVAAEWQWLSTLWRDPTETTSLVKTFPVIWALPLAAAVRYDSAGTAGKRSLLLLAVIATVYVAGVLATSPTWGGAQWGPRLLLLAVPLLALLTAACGSLRGVSGRITLCSICLLALVSVGIQASSVKLLANIKGLYVKTVINFQQVTAPSDVLVSDQFFFHEILAPLYYQRRFFYLASPDLTSDFIRSLRRNSVSHFYYFFRRGEDATDLPQDVTEDLLRQLARHGLLGQQLTLERCTVMVDMPYYFVRLGTDVRADASATYAYPLP